MASCSSSASRSPNPQFRFTWCRGQIGHCRPGRPSSAITWKGLRRLICLWFPTTFRISGSRARAAAVAVVRGDPQSDAEWLARQITEAFPWDTAPKYLIRDNDRAFGVAFKARVRAMGIRDRPTSYRSPWQNGYVERLIGSIRRECADHLLVFNVEHLRRILSKIDAKSVAYLSCYS
jgi:transposase InsO family protein